MTGVLLKYNASFELALRKFTSAFEKQKAKKSVGDNASTSRNTKQ